MEKKLKKLSKKVNIFLNRYLSKFNSSELVVPMKYGLFPGGKKIRSKIIFDLIFFPPGNNPYFIGKTNSEELNFDKYLFKKKLTLLDSFFSFFSIAYYFINFVFSFF